MVFCPDPGGGTGGSPSLHPSPSDPALIRLVGVTKRYGSTVALKDVHLAIYPGEFVAVVGLSGAGKSTLLRAINRLVEVDEGEIWVLGQNVREASPEKLRVIRRQIGMIFQHFHLVPRLTVFRNVLAGRAGYLPAWKVVLGLFPEEDRRLARQALQRVGLEEKIFSRADRLSGGQQQRVAIARALCQEPRVLLADEPVASLDPVTTEMIMEDLARINRQLGITTVVNLHSVDLARRYATRIIGMRAGEVVFDGPVAKATPQVFASIYGKGRAAYREEAFPAGLTMD
ncbi:MAG: phosphonate ABC transporter ATP-binding protein [Clostridiales bacterium]|nr:phosphonate ABC transporter ATP-binding protein [Clostridiales bacterium]